MGKSRLLGFLIIIILLGILSYFYPVIQENLGITGKASSSGPQREEAILLQVIDGDTIVVTGDKIGNETHIRLLGINTPEKKMPFSNESRNYLSPFRNKTIILEQDREDKDKYGRSLRYVFYNDRLLNQEILELGLANSYMLDGLRYKQTFIDAENQAKNLHIGIWTPSSELCSVKNCISLEQLNYTEEFFVIKNNCDIVCDLTNWFVKDAGRNTFKLGIISPNEEKTYPSGEGKEIWNNDGDKFFMFDKKGYLVIFYQYP